MILDPRRLRRVLLPAVMLCLGGFARAADEPFFSGPQPGEKLPAFAVRDASPEGNGREVDFVAAADGKPLLLIFVQDVNRPSIQLTRLLGNYAKSREADGLRTGLVFLHEDAAKGEALVARIRHALPAVPTGVSPDGLEGPGTYGLNRKATLTILVGRRGVVTANFALVQPSIPVDLPRAVEAIVKEVGGKVPEMKELLGAEAPPPARGEAPDLRALLRPVIRLDADAAEVERAAAAVEALAAKDPAARAEIGRIASTIVNSGKIDNYGTPKAREFLKKWAAAPAPTADSQPTPNSEPRP